MQPKASANPYQATISYEAALLECAAGRKAAVARIYRGEKEHLRSVVKRIVRNQDRVDDVIHDAFIQILRDSPNFDPSRGSARAWIYTIVRNTALKSLRKASREVPVEDERLDAMRERRVGSEDADDRMAEYATLRACLEALEPQRRASLILAIIDGRTHAEIAHCLGVPIGTVKSWIRRELVALRSQMK
jgi:RNA polymerase sigma-70 factor (ECF subfamily)